MGDRRREIPVVFISSASEDLKTHRERVRDAALTAGFHPVMMEYFTANGARPPLPECLAKVSDADVVVVLVAHRYGWIPPDQPDGGKKSITWLECEKAVKEGKEVLAFVVDESRAWPEEHREVYEITKAVTSATPELLATVQRNVNLLGEFKAWLGGLGIRGKFTTPEDVFGKVSAALPDWRERHRAAGSFPSELTITRRDPAPYFRWLLERTATISIRGLQVGTGKAHRFPIDDLFIPLSTTLSPEPGGREKGRRHDAPKAGEAELGRGRVRLEDALSHDRLVIVGDPGAGKSTFLRRIAFVLSRDLMGEGAESNPFPLGLAKRPFPILIELARLAEHMAASVTDSSRPTTTSSPAWLRHYLAAVADEFSWGLDEAFFRQQLESGSCIVLLDGLDEAPSRASRENLSTLIEEATGTFSCCQFVVTGRPAAFVGRAALPGFTQVQIEPLEDSAIETFLTRWCEALYPESQALAHQHRSKLSEALRFRPEIRRMARNPVMLTALAVVHWNERRLPEQRADLYESIVTWLSRSREQRPGRMPAERTVTLLQNLALAMQDHPKGRQVQMPKLWAAERIGPALREVSEEDRISAAEKFLDEEEVDSGIIVGRGRDVRFWHLTFQEFLAARALAGRPDDDLRQILITPGKHFRPEWREVVLLLAGVQHRYGPEKVDGLIAAILNHQGQKPSLADHARCAGLVGAVLRDLAPLRYQPSDPRWTSILEAVRGIFDPAKSRPIPIETRIEAAEALGQAGDPRLEEDKWVKIAGGTFLMGAQRKDSSEPNYDLDAANRESPVHEVSLDAFEIARYPLTVSEYQKFLEDGGYEARRCWSAGGFGEFKEPEFWEEQKAFPNRPVVGVSWYEALAYCAWSGVRLPTEAEWERAARGFEGRNWPWGNAAPRSARLNFAESNIGRPTPVGIYPLGATPDGIFDLAGNVWEWVADWYESYSATRVENPKGPDAGTARVLRGGGCWNDARDCRPAHRSSGHPADCYGNVGFRPARSLPSAL